MILLDTCTLLWLSTNPDLLSQGAKEAVRTSGGRLFVSSVSAFETAVKSKKGQIRLPFDTADWFVEVLHRHGILEILVSSAIIFKSVDLPLLHRDPCDRIIVATAQMESLTVLTPDSSIQQYPNVRWLW